MKMTPTTKWIVFGGGALLILVGGYFLAKRRGWFGLTPKA